jgi:hypothetical protein
MAQKKPSYYPIINALSLEGFDTVERNFLLTRKRKSLSRPCSIIDNDNRHKRIHLSEEKGELRESVE